MKINKQFIRQITIAAHAVILAFLLCRCSEVDPQKEDVPELITKTTLTFTPSPGGTPVTATASDPDGMGVQNIRVDGPINLAANETYVLTIELINALASPSDAAYNVTFEVEEEGDEHLFFFAWTNDVFANPSGNGNIDNRNDPLNYDDGTNSKDVNGLPLGLTTTWTTSTLPPGGSLTGTFRVALKHQPELKSATSNFTSGETDLDLTFEINVQ